MVGGKFFPMLKRGTQAPAAKKVMMTTTTDKQSSIDVVIVLSADDQHKSMPQRRPNSGELGDTLQLL